MSGNRQTIEWQTFGPLELMTLTQKQASDAKGSTISDFRTAAINKGIPVSKFDHFMWIINDGISTLGTTPNDSLVGALGFAPRVTMHEMTHSFGVCCHADSNTYDDYGDPFCIMGSTGGARSFDNPRLAFSSQDAPHTASGPGICAPYLFVAGWLDRVANITALPALSQAIGSTITLDANQGAPSFGSFSQIALTIGGVPKNINDPPQYWVEFRITRNFDRAIDTPPLSTIPDIAGHGVLLLHEVRFLAARCTALHSSLKGFVGASQGNTLTLPDGRALKIANVNSGQGKVSLVII